MEQKPVNGKEMYAESPQELVSHLAKTFSQPGVMDCIIRVSDLREITITKAEFNLVMNDPEPPAGVSLVERILAEAEKKYEPSPVELEEMGRVLLSKMGDAEIRYINDGDEPGIDANGDTFAIEGKLMFTVYSYPDGVEFFDNEVGCVIADNMEGQVIRMVRVEQPGNA